MRQGELLARRSIRASSRWRCSSRPASALRDEAQLDAARVTLQRFRTLLEQDSIARQEVDTQAALVKQLEAAVVVSRPTKAAPG